MALQGKDDLGQMIRTELHKLHVDTSFIRGILHSFLSEMYSTSTHNDGVLTHHQSLYLYVIPHAINYVLVTLVGERYTSSSLSNCSSHFKF